MKTLEYGMFDELDNAIDKMMEEQNKLLDDAYQ